MCLYNLLVQESGKEYSKNVRYLEVIKEELARLTELED
jgi:hypothetical protein